MFVSSPKINPQTYYDILVKTEALVEFFTNQSIRRDMLVGRTLDEDVIDATTGNTIALKGIIVDVTLADTIVQLADVNRVRVKGWQHPGSVEVSPLRELLVGNILNTTIVAPVTNEIIATSGQEIDAALAEQIETTTNLSRVSVKVQPPRLITVPPTFESLLYRVLDEDVLDPVTNDLVAARGDYIDIDLADTISALVGLPLVRIRVEADASWALIRIFGRFMELVIERLNQVPDKNFLAFLDLIGTQVRPPQPARVPLTFQLSAGRQVGAYVPMQTRVAAPAEEGEVNETIFETERDLVVTPAQLKGVFVRDPHTDQFADYTFIATTVDDDVFPVFIANQPIEHSIYLAHDNLFRSSGAKDLRLEVNTPFAGVFNALPISWSYWNGQGWRLLSPSPRIVNGLNVSVDNTTRRITVTTGVAIDESGQRIEVPSSQTLSLGEFQDEPVLVMVSWSATLESLVLQLVAEADVDDYPTSTYIQIARLVVDANNNYKHAFAKTTPTNIWQIAIDKLPELIPTTVDGLEAGWLRARLDTACPHGTETIINSTTGQRQITREGLFPSIMIVNQTVQDKQPFYPFGNTTSPQLFYLSLPEAFARPNAQLTIDISLIEAGLISTNPVSLLWTYWDGAGWRRLGQSSPANPSITPITNSFSDATQALTTDGQVNFISPTNWSQRELFRSVGYWLRVQVAAGDYGLGSALQPPQIGLLQLNYQWDIPRIETIHARLTTQQVNLIPEQGLANTTTVDLTTNFFPFGERPKAGDVFYLNSPVAFSKPGAQITLTITLSNPVGSAQDGSLKPVKPSSNLQIDWEVWNGQSWFNLAHSSVTTPPSTTINPSAATFTQNGTVTFTLPPRLGEGIVNGEPGYWVRARIVQGNYGIEGIVTVVNNVANFTQPTFAPPYVASLSLTFTYNPPAEALSACLTYNDFHYVNHTPTAREAGTFFEPFVATLDTHTAYYLGFDRAFANRPMSLYAKVKPVLYSDDLLKIKKTITEPAQVRWEYGNRDEWASLGVRDETVVFAERGLISFIGPKNIAPRSEFGQDLYWLRARWDSGQFVVMPHLHYVLTNTTWASQFSTLQNEILGSSNGEPNQVFQLTQFPVLLTQQIEVREFELPSEEERANLEAEEGEDALTITAATAGQPTAIWVRWHQVPDFHGSNVRSRHYIFDPLTGTIYFGNGQYGMIPPQGRNNIRARLYQIGGGVKGNRLAQTINQLKSTVPYIDGTINFEAASGGADLEDMAQVKERGPRVLRHRGRAVAAQDFADLAREASTDVARARTITPNFDPFDQEWIPPDTIANAGQVGVIIVPNGTEAQPIPSLELINRVEEYILARCVPTLDLWVAGPDWVEIFVEAEVVPTSLEVANTLETTIIAALQNFIHPLRGGLDGGGWVFGREPYTSDMYHLIESIEGVDYIRSLTLHKTGVNTARLNRFLIYSGAHQISLVSE
jgi:hypothetical protein